MNEQQPVDLQRGMLVFTSDGDELGRINEIEGDCFKLDVQMQVDFWLPMSAVESTEFGVARLSMPKAAFNQRRELDIGHAGVHRH